MKIELTRDDLEILHKAKIYCSLAKNFFEENPNLVMRIDVPPRSWFESLNKYEKNCSELDKPKVGNLIRKLTC